MAQSIPQTGPERMDQGLARILALSPLGLDSLVLLIALFPMTFKWEWYFAAHMRVLPVQAIGVFSVCAYLLGVVYLLLDYWGRERDTTRARYVVLGLLIINLVIAPMMTSAIVRHVTGQTERWIHDAPIQMEEAVKVLLRGQNPYATDYVDTPLARWPYYEGPVWTSRWQDPPPPEAKVNPAMYHVAYLPFTLLITVPLHLISTWTLGWFDGRLVNLLAYLFTLWLLTRLIHAPTHRLAVLILVGLNPLLVPFIVEGRNDILVFSLLLAAAITWQRRQPRASAVWLGLALATKHVAVLFLPFYLLLILDRDGAWSQRLAALVRRLTPMAVTTLALTLPFVLWDWRAFVEDTVGYIGGMIPTSYPLSGMGIGGIAVIAGWVPNAGAPFPALVLQTLLAGPLLLMLLRRQWRVNTLRNALVSYGLFLMVFMWLARFFFDNYLGYILMVLSMGALWPLDDTCA